MDRSGATPYLVTPTAFLSFKMWVKTPKLYLYVYGLQSYNNVSCPMVAILNLTDSNTLGTEKEFPTCISRQLR
jgi:hypothetical protein